MKLKDQEVIAAEYALGTLDRDDRARVRDALDGDPALRALTDAWDRRLAPLREVLPPAEPPADLLPKIEQRLFGIDAGLPGTMTLRADEGEWDTLSVGVEVKVLHQNPVSRRRSLLIRIAPGAIYEPHDHVDDEECYVLAGDLSFGDHHLKAGDFHLALKGGTHPPSSSRGGCLLFISTVPKAA